MGTLLPSLEGPIKLGTDCDDCGRSLECKGESELGQGRKAEASCMSWGHGQEFSFTPVAVRSWCWILGKKEHSLILFWKAPTSSETGVQGIQSEEITVTLPQPGCWGLEFRAPPMAFLFLAQLLSHWITNSSEAVGG